jgi:branched-chain amino acid transport system permease protein
MNIIGFTNNRDNTPAGLWKLIGGGVLAVVLLYGVAQGLSYATNGRYDSLLLFGGISAVITVGYQIFVGNSGIVSFGHPAFVAVGAYAGGIVSMSPALKTTILPDLPPILSQLQLGFVPSLLIGGAAAALLALLIGPIVLRLAGATAGIMTFGLLVIVNEVLRNATTFTRGTQTFFGVPKLANFATVYGTLLAAVVVAVVFKFSEAGLHARAVRDEPLAAETAGIKVVTSRLWAWVVSAFVMGAAGALFGFYLTAFSPKSFYVELVIPMMVMAVLGGSYSVLGAIVGTVLITFWGQLMRLGEDGLFGFPMPVGSSQFTLGVALVLLLYWRPHGLLRSLELKVSPPTGTPRA